MELTKKQNYPAIDGLRAFSAIGIVLMHVFVNSSYQLSGFIFDEFIESFTNLVFLFMIVSGFGICCGYYDKIIHNKVTVGEFYGKRFAKIWPFFAFMSIVELCSSPSMGSVYEAFANMTLFFGFLDKEITVIGVGWFIGVVFIFYLVFPFMCYLLSDKKRAWLAFAAALALNFACERYFGVKRQNFAFSFVFFFTGGLIFLYRGQLERFAQKFRILVLLLLAAGGAAYWCIGDYTPVLLVLYALCLIYALGSPRRILSNPVTRFLGSISMEVYLCHMAVFRVLQKLKLTVLFGDGLLSYVVTCVVTLAGAVVIAWGFKKVWGLVAGKLRLIGKKQPA